MCIQKAMGWVCRHFLLTAEDPHSCTCTYWQEELSRDQQVNVTLFGTHKFCRSSYSRGLMPWFVTWKWCHGLSHGNDLCMAYVWGFSECKLGIFTYSMHIYEFFVHFLIPNAYSPDPCDNHGFKALLGIFYHTVVIYNRLTCNTQSCIGFATTLHCHTWKVFHTVVVVDGGGAFLSPVWPNQQSVTVLYNCRSPILLDSRIYRP